MEYFKCEMANSRRWSLAIQREFVDHAPVDIWAYSRGEIVKDVRQVPLCVDSNGDQVDFNPTAFGAIVVSLRMAEIVASIAGNDVQRIPAIVAHASGEWEVLNVLAVVDCINYEKSIIQYFPSDHPEKPGKPRGVMRLVIDSNEAGGHHILKPDGWMAATIVSAKLKRALNQAGIRGIEYSSVAG